MNKELSDRAWKILPKEFKEEVKKIYSHNPGAKPMPENTSRGKAILRDIFGHDNLASDAEGEDMLTVSRKDVQEIYKQNHKEIHRENVSSSDKDCYEYANEVLKTLFGSKCLPDEAMDDTMGGAMGGAMESNVDSSMPNVESLDSNVDSLKPKPAVPKFKVGDYVRYKGGVHKVVATAKDNRCYLNKILGCIDESDLEPYTEPEVKRHVSVKEVCEILGVDESEATTLAKSEPTETCTDDCPSQCPSHLRNLSEETANCDKCPKSVQKTHPDFGHSRLQIAAMAMQGLLSNTTRFSSYEISDLVRISLNCADALIAEAEKGGEQ